MKIIKPFKPLIEPREPLSFWVGRLLIHLNFARTWTWADDRDTHRGIERRTHLFAFDYVRTEEPRLSCLMLIVGPLKINVGLK